MSSKKTSSYGVVVVSFGSDQVLASFLTSLQESDLTTGHVVIVENGPTLPELSDTTPWGTTLLHLPHNPGYGAAVNRGVEALPSEFRWVLVSNPDVALEKTATKSLIEEAIDRDRCGAVGPALLNSDGSVYPSARALPSIRVGVGHALFAALWPTNPWTKAYRGTYDSDESRSVGWLSGACFLVNREAFTEIDGFDTGYFMFVEDVDLGMRLGDAGWSSVYAPRARALHTVGHVTKDHRGAMAKAHHTSMKRFLRKRYPGPLSLPLRLVLNLGLTLRQILVQAVWSIRKTSHTN